MRQVSYYATSGSAVTLFVSEIPRYGRSWFLVTEEQQLFVFNLNPQLNAQLKVRYFKRSFKGYSSSWSQLINYELLDCCVISSWVLQLKLSLANTAWMVCLMFAVAYMFTKIQCSIIVLWKMSKEYTISSAFLSGSFPRKMSNHSSFLCKTGHQKAPCKQINHFPK